MTSLPWRTRIGLLPTIQMNCSTIFQDEALFALPPPFPLWDTKQINMYVETSASCNRLSADLDPNCRIDTWAHSWWGGKTKLNKLYPEAHVPTSSRDDTRTVYVFYSYLSWGDTTSRKCTPWGQDVAPCKALWIKIAHHALQRNAIAHHAYDFWFRTLEHSKPWLWSTGCESIWSTSRHVASQPAIHVPWSFRPRSFLEDFLRQSKEWQLF